MRNFTLIAALAVSTCLAAPALAQDGGASDTGPYVQIEAGYAFGEDTGFTPPFPSPDDAVALFTDGYEIGAAIGYDFGGFRVEGEIAHRDIGLDGTIASQGNPYGFAGV